MQIAPGSRLVAFILALLCVPAWAAESSPPAWLKPDPRALARWQAMRFGMFIHWGPVALTGQEIGWSRGAHTPVAEYDNLYKRFDAPKFDANAWVATAKAAGMKYIVLTTKHHDGFCLWDTKQTDFNVMRSPLARDVTKELAEACRRGEIAFGTYHSVCDWHHPDFPRTSPGGKVVRERSDVAAYRRYLRAQVTELIQNYGPLVTMWFDVPQEFDRVEGAENIRICRALQPDVLVNNRAGGGMGDYATPEQRIGGFNIDQPWETCMTICHQWSWRPDDKMKSLAECLGTLVRTAGGDGNLLFNVGPMPNGEIEARQVDRLRQMGEWLAKYGASVYGTRGGPYKPAKHVVSTRRHNLIYLHVLAWPEETLKLPGLSAKVLGARLLSGGQTRFQQTAESVELNASPPDRQEIDTVIELTVDRPAMEIAPITVNSIGQPLTEGKPVKTSNVYQKNNHYGAAMAVDGDEHTRWATDASVGQCWLEVDLGTATTFDRAVIQECVDFGVRVKSFSLEYQDGQQWKPCHSGKGIGKNLDVRFPPVTARRVRLNIDGERGPTIAEFQLFAPATKP